MAQVSLEPPDGSPKDESTGSETPIRSSLCGHTSTEDSELRSIIEEKAFRALSQGSLIKRPHLTFCVSEPDDDNDFLSLTFPKKLWKIVDSDKFKSIWWDEDGTSIVINEELFKKEILERKAPFRIFETDIMKSFVRRLNLYGFSKMRKNFPRSASLADFLAEEKEVSTLNKLQFYRNPNFKRGCPQLLVRMKRRVGIKNTSPVTAPLVPDPHKKHLRAGGNADNRNSGLADKASRESLFSTSTNLSLPLLKKPSTSHRIANTTDLRTSDFSPPSISAKPSEQSVTDQHAIFNQLTSFHSHSLGSYTQESVHIVNLNFVTTSSSKYYILPNLENRFSGLMMVPSAIPIRYPDLSTSEVPESNQLTAGNPWYLVPTITDTSAASHSKSTDKYEDQTSSLQQQLPNNSLASE